jgi:hypothetical protein
MSEQPRDPALTALEAALAALKPAPDGIDRDGLLFRAGQASVRRPSWLWPGAAAVLAVLLAGVLVWRPVKVVERIVYVEVPAPQTDSPGYDAVTLPEPPVPEGYLRLRQLVLRDGVEALSTHAGPDRQPNRPGIRAIPLSGDSL